MSQINLLLLPGLPCDARLWQHQISGLADIAHSVVANLTIADNLRELAEAAVAMMPPGRFAMAGMSMGGYVAFEIMRQYPERVMGLALLDTTARIDTPEGADGRRRLMQLAEQNFPTVIQALLPRLLHPARLVDKPLVDLIVAMAESNGAAAFRRQQIAILGRPDSRPDLTRIHCPTLVLCGRDDQVTPVAVAEELADMIPDAHLKIIEHCGHFAPLEQPIEVTAAMREWLFALNN